MNESLQIGNGNWGVKSGSFLGYRYDDEFNLYFPRETPFTRASTGTRVNASGVVVTEGSNIPRIDNSTGATAWMLEPQRTNSIRNSTMVGASTSPSTLPTNWINLNGNGLTRTVVGVGTENGLPYVDIRVNGTATGTINSFATENINIIAAITGQSWSNSFYAKIISQPNPPVAYQFQTIYFNSGVYVNETNNTYTPTTTLARYSAVNTVPSGTITHLTQAIRFTLTNGNAYDFTIRIAAPQLELGAFATSYIPTTTAAATRIADSFSYSNIYTNGLISPTGGTWFVHLRNNVQYVRDTFTAGLYISDTTDITSNNINIRNGGGGTVRMGINKVIGGVSTFLYLTTTDTVKIAIKWNGTTADIFANGTKVISATSFTPTIMQNLGLTSGQVPYFIQAMNLYPIVLSDAECIALTT